MSPIADTHLISRAPRYPIEIFMRYRTSDEAPWREARTENISRSGVLFRTDHAMPIQASIEMLLPLPAEVSGADTATVVCRGRVVRTEAPADSTDWPAVAATIGACRLTHELEGDPRRI
jgi:hypothetical protein